MKKAIQLVWLIGILACNSAQKDSMARKLDKPNEKLTYQKLYSEGESRREYFAQITANPSTSKKEYIKRNDNNQINITLFHNKNRIYSLVYRNTTPNGDMKFNCVFDFNDLNICISNTTWDDKDLMEYTNAIFGDSLIRFDVHYNKIELNPTQKKEIIQSAKASLDSMMQHFPEFRYSINWK